jgi:hypothetical protein
MSADDRRRANHRAALGFLRLPPTEPELVLLHRALDHWHGLGQVVVGMRRHGFQVRLGEHGAGQWIAVFFRGRGGHEPIAAAGTAQEATPWRALQRAAWEALGSPWKAMDRIGGRRLVRPTKLIP